MFKSLNYNSLLSTDDVPCFGVILLPSAADLACASHQSQSNAAFPNVRLQQCTYLYCLAFGDSVFISLLLNFYHAVILMIQAMIYRAALHTSECNMVIWCMS